MNIIVFRLSNSSTGFVTRLCVFSFIKRQNLSFYITAEWNFSSKIPLFLDGRPVKRERTSRWDIRLSRVLSWLCFKVDSQADTPDVFVSLPPDFWHNVGGIPGGARRPHRRCGRRGQRPGFNSERVDRPDFTEHIWGRDCFGRSGVTCSPQRGLVSSYFREESTLLRKIPPASSHEANCTFPGLCRLGISMSQLLERFFTSDRSSWTCPSGPGGLSSCSSCCQAAALRKWMYWTRQQQLFLPPLCWQST